MTATLNNDPKKLTTILQDVSLSMILNKAKLIESFNMALTRYLSSQLLTHCRVMNYESSIIIIGIDSAIWATQLRYHEQELLHYFKNQPELPNVLGIKYKIQ